MEKKMENDCYLVVVDKQNILVPCNMNSLKP